MTHTLKLLLLLSDEAQIAHRRDTEIRSVEKEKDDIKQDVARLLNSLIRP